MALRNHPSGLNSSGLESESFVAGTLQAHPYSVRLTDYDSEIVTEMDLDGTTGQVEEPVSVSTH